jgi:hypothetical protein
MSKLQKKPSALKRGHPTLQNMNFYQIVLLLLVIFALLDPDPDPLARLNPDPIRIRNPAFFFSKLIGVLDVPTAHINICGYQCCRSRMFIPDPKSEFCHPGSWIQGQKESQFRIRNKELKYFNRKILSKRSEI